MSSGEKATVLTRVDATPEPKRRALARLGIPKSTYYRWLKRVQEGSLEDRPGGSRIPWNRLTPEEKATVLEMAREMPELSSRQLAAWITDHEGFSVSESTVYRILKGEGLIKSPEIRLVAGKEYHRKTMRPHQMWATDASYFKVMGWGYYYLVPTCRDGRLFQVHPGLGTATRHDGRLTHRSDTGGHRCHQHD